MKRGRTQINRFLQIVFAMICAASALTLSLNMPASAKQYSSQDFVHAEGTKIIGRDGKELLIKGMALGNSVWGNPSTPDYSHHDKNTYKELSELGFNCVRFYINYGLFEDDSNPYHYKKSGFDWLDKNIRWAKKYKMGIIINMHYPQGGYQSNGEGTELWTNKSYQNRLVSLWKKIARRYSNEPTVWGYGLVNEPVVPMKDTMEETYEQYNKLMNRIVTAIRGVSPYQAVFVEGICAAVNQNGEREYEYFTPENCFAQIDDSNIVYEFHDYNPFYFTHQNTDWAGTKGCTMTYPSAEIVSEDVVNGWVKCQPADKVVTKKNGWTYFKSKSVSRSADANVISAAVTASGLGENSSVYFDDIRLIEISPNGKSKTLFKADFSDGILNSTPWSEDGSGVSEYCAEEGNLAAGCLKISGTTALYVQNFKRFEMKEGYSYVISGYVKYDAGNPEIRMDMSLSKNLRSFDRNYLKTGFLPYVEFSEKHNVPLYLGEFGVIAEGFENGRNGIGWVKDMIKLCRKYGIGFNYHVYNEFNFGLYDAYPNGKNDELAELFNKLL